MIGVMPFVVVALSLGCCGPALQQADIDEFLETGSTNVVVRSAIFKADSATLIRAVSGTPVTCDLVIINPKALDVSYTLGWDVADALFIDPPSSAPEPNAVTDLSFSFILNPSAAEHKTITFSLGKYVASLNKTYDTNTFSILCDSPPNPVSRLSVVMDSGQKSTLAVLLPAEPSDDDLTSVRITWGMEGAGTTKTSTYAIPSLSAQPISASFSSKYDCYFQSPDCLSGNGYAYEVVVIDAAGQESSAVTITSTANSFYVKYDGNGNTAGSAPASVGYRFAATAVVASAGDLTKTGCAFSHWNTAADGTGTSYSPGAAFTIPAGDVKLYAQWVSNGTGVIIETPTNYQALTFAIATPTVTQGEDIRFKTNNAVLAAVTNGWTWYVDEDQEAEQSETLTFDGARTGAMLGSYLITARVTIGGVTYSGSLTLTVER